MAKIRVRLNRQLTFAEAETFRSVMADSKTDDLTWHFSDAEGQIPARAAVYITTHEDGEARDLYEGVAMIVERAFVNVHPTAVRTYED